MNPHGTHSSSPGRVPFAELSIDGSAFFISAPSKQPRNGEVLPVRDRQPGRPINDGRY